VSSRSPEWKGNQTPKVRQGQLFGGPRRYRLRGVLVTEKLAKSALHKGSISEYSLNPYSGCEHACAYCYACFVRRFTAHTEAWGRFVDVKINIAGLLQRELSRLRPGTVFISSICDPYQPLERKYKLTRKCLELLAESDFTVDLITKNVLVRRDFEVLEKMKEKVSLTMTITTTQDSLARTLEGGASLPRFRLKALRDAADRGISIGVMCAPLIPYVTASEENLTKLFRDLSSLELDYVLLDRFNPYAESRRRLLGSLKTRKGNLAGGLERLLKDPEALKAENARTALLAQRIAGNFGLASIIRSFI